MSVSRIIKKCTFTSDSDLSVLSDLIGDLPEVQPVSNISTAADLLKQGAGEFFILSSRPKTHCCVST